MKKLKAPVLIIGGEEDAIPVGSFEQWQESLPNSFFFKIPQSVHFPHVDQPNAFFSAVELFLQNKMPDESLLQVRGAGIILAGDAISSFWYTGAVRGMSSIELQLMDLEISGDFLIGRGKYQMNDQQEEILDIGKFVDITVTDSVM